MSGNGKEPGGIPRGQARPVCRRHAAIRPPSVAVPVAHGNLSTTFGGLRGYARSGGLRGETRRPPRRTRTRQAVHPRGSAGPAGASSVRISLPGKRPLRWPGRVWG